MTLTDPESPVEFALLFASEGLHVVPIPPRSKHPTMPAWQTKGSIDRERITHWWSEQPDYGIGIVTGSVSGIIVVDLDESELVSGSDMLADLEAQHERLPDTLEVLTGGGGRHLYFRWRGEPISNDAGRLLGPGIDIRGEGGQVVAPPSLHASGQRYEFEASCGWPHIRRIAELPSWLADMLVRPSRPERPSRDRVVAGHRSGDKWMAATSWHDLLTGDGAHYLGERVDRVSGLPYQLYGRPALPGEEGFTPHISASCNYREGDVLKVFTSNWARPGEWFLEQGETYTKLGYLAITRFHGDYTAAVGHLETLGFTADPDPRDDVTKLVATAPASPADDGWDDPVPLGDDTPLPPFPLDVFPAWMRDHIVEVADELNVAPDLPGLLGLGAVATLTHGRVKVHVAGQWVEHVNLYLLIGAPSGSGKSPALKAMFRPVYAFETMLRDEARDEVDRAVTRLRVLDAQLKRAVNAAEPDEATIEQIRGRRLLAATAPTVLPKLTAGDITPEALTQRMAGQGGRMAVVSSEGTPLQMAIGRYSEHPAVEVYLQGFTGDKIERDRAKDGEETLIAEAILSIVCCVQPDLLVELGSNRSLRQRGYTARFLYSVLPDQPGLAPLRPAHEPTPAHVLYDEQLIARGRWARRYEHPRVLVFDLAAQHTFERWRTQTSQTGVDPGIVSKIQIAVARTSGLLAVAHRGDQAGAVLAEDVERAARLGDYWLAHVERLETLWALDPLADDAAHVLRWLRNRSGRSAQFTLRELQRAQQRRFNGDSARAACLVLAEHGWLRVLDGSLTRRGVSATLLAHPSVVSPVSLNFADRLRPTVTPVGRFLERGNSSISSSLSIPDPPIGRDLSDTSESRQPTTPAESDDIYPANSIWRHLRRPSDE